MIQNPAKMSLSKGQLLLQNDDGDFTLPLEDISAIVLESQQIALTSSLLSACQEQAVAVLTCDETHTPNGVMLPFLPHSRQSKVARTQIGWTDSLKNRLWQKTVQAKIANQAKCLEFCRDKNTATRIAAMARQVDSGDSANIEAQAARDYWSKLFGTDFHRDGYGAINAALNYGYAVIRAFVARSQVAYGLLPTFGIHHDGELNAFNLTDDMMEPFRPIADARVFAMFLRGDLPEDGNLTKENRQHLATLGSSLCKIEGQKQTLMNACDRMAAGLVSAIEAKSTALLPLPEFIPPDTPPFELSP
jgi:CRISPR-associated protein Cas1